MMEGFGEIMTLEETAKYLKSMYICNSADTTSKCIISASKVLTTLSEIARSSLWKMLISGNNIG